MSAISKMGIREICEGISDLHPTVLSTEIYRLRIQKTELLEALKMANEMLKDCAEELSASGMSPIAECIRTSTALIAKAEGK